MINPYVYTTIENQFRSDGTFGLLYDHFSDLARAEAKYFTICAAAAISELPYHSAHILRSDGVIIEGHVWDRRIPPTPETDPGPEEE